MFGFIESKEVKNPKMLKFILDLSHVIWLMPFEAAAEPSFIKAGWRGLQHPQASTMADPGYMVSCFPTDSDYIYIYIDIYYILYIYFDNIGLILLKIHGYN